MTHTRPGAGPGMAPCATTCVYTEREREWCVRCAKGWRALRAGSPLGKARIISRYLALLQIDAFRLITFDYVYNCSRKALSIEDEITLHFS